MFIDSKARRPTTQYVCMYVYFLLLSYTYSTRFSGSSINFSLCLCSNKYSNTKYSNKYPNKIQYFKYLIVFGKKVFGIWTNTQLLNLSKYYSNTIKYFFAQITPHGVPTQTPPPRGTPPGYPPCTVGYLLYRRRG